MTHSSYDEKLLIISTTIAKSQGRADLLIEILHQAQKLFGYLDRSILWGIARQMKVPPSRVYGVATFYHLFRLHPPGTHECVVCTGTACFVKGSDQLLSSIEQTCQLTSGHTTADGTVSMVTARCVGTCGIAPVVVLDGTMIGPITPAQLVKQVTGWQSHGST